MAKITKEQLAKMTREEKLEYYELLQEKKRRKLAARDSYVPNSGQAEVHKSKKRVRAVFAGNGGGKTALGVNEAIWAATGYNPITGEHTPVPASVVVVLDKPEKIEKTWLPEIQKWYPLDVKHLHKRGKPYIAAITFDNGSEISFAFHDQEAMTFESIEVDKVIFDEPPPKHVFIALMRGGRKKGRKARFLIIGTPIAMPWLRTDIYEPWTRGELPDTECFRYGTAVNASNLAEGYMDDFGRYLSEKEKQIRFEGAFFDLEGLALAHLFKRDTHIIPPPKWPGHWPVLVIVDPHPSKSHIALMLGVTQGGGLRALKEYSSKSAARPFARELKEFMQGYRVVDIVSDSLGSSDSTGGEGRLSFIQVLRDEGIRIRATSYDEKQDEAWIQMIQDVLVIPDEPNNFGERLPKLQVSSACTGLIADVETVQWAKVKNIDDYKPKLDISRKDYLACLKYGLAAQPRFDRGRERVIRGQAPASWNNKEKWRKPQSGY